MKKKYLCLLALLFPFSLQAQNAQDFNRTLHLFIKNETPVVWEFQQVIESKPGNHFKVEPQRVAPFETVHITAEKNLNNDLSAILSFKNPQGKSAILYVLDQEQLHMGQPVFNFSGAHVFSQLTRITRNPNVGARYLSIIEAELKVTTNQ